jgi:hypothetical protein
VRLAHSRAVNCTPRTSLLLDTEATQSKNGFATATEGRSSTGRVLGAATRNGCFIATNTGWKATETDDRAAFWLRCLQNDYRIHASDAIQATWARLKDSGDEVPMQGPIANDFWRLLIRDERLHEELFNHALHIKSQSGILFDRFYEYLMSRLLATFWRSEDGYAEPILRWHERFVNDYFIRPGALNELAHAAMLSRSNLRILRAMYRRGSCLPRKGIYDQIVPELCKLKEWKLALDWHFFLYSQRDFPQGSSFLQQTFRARPTLEDALAEFLSGKAGVEIKHDLNMNAHAISEKDNSQVFNPATLSEIDDDEFKAAVDKMDEKPRHAPLSDEFCARLFATKGLSIPSIIHYFQMFDHGKLGPLALRELMARAEDLDQAAEYLQAFEKANIVTGSSVYPRVIKHFLKTHQFDLLDNLVQSDLHPETLGERHVQVSLLKHYITQKEELSVRRTIEILKMITPSKRYQGTLALADNEITETEKRKLNQLDRLFIATCMSRQPHDIQLLIDDCMSQGIQMDPRKSGLLSKFCMRPQDHHKDGNFAIENDLEFVSNIIVRLMKSGQPIAPMLWKPVLSRLGMLGHLQQVFRMFAFFIQEHYNKPLISQSSNRLGYYESQRTTTPLEEISTYLAENHPQNTATKYRLHYASSSIIAWGFKQSLPMLTSTEQFHSDPAPVFLSGLRFLSELSVQGFSADHKMVASAVNRRLLHLYGTLDSRRPYNRWIKENNYFSLEELLVSIEQVWAGPRLFPELYNNADVAVVDRHARKEPRYMVKEEDFSVNPTRGSQPVKFPSAKGTEAEGASAWAHASFRNISERFGGSILDGLLNETSNPFDPVLDEQERIDRRIQLRYLFLGTEPPLPNGPDGENAMTQVAWDAFIRESAVRADKALVRAGLCRAS